MESELDRIKKKESVAKVVYWVFLFALIVPLALLPDQVRMVLEAPVIANAVMLVFGAGLVVSAFYHGKFYAMRCSRVSLSVYYDNRKFAWVVSGVMAGLLFIIGATSFRVAEWDLSAWILPGAIFLICCFVLDFRIWQCFWLKRLGKVEPE